MCAEYWRFSRERRKAQKDYQRYLDVLRDGERHTDKPFWTIYDSSLDFDEWNFDSDFYPVIPGWKGLMAFVSEEFSNMRGKLVGLELGGPGSRCFADFPVGLFRLTAGVTLADLRNDEKRGLDEQRDHHVIEFDVSHPLLGRKIEEKLGVSRAHLIIERMAGGLPDWLKDPYFLYQVGNRWYNLLETPGVMFVQYPEFIHEALPSWVAKVKVVTGGTVAADYHYPRYQDMTSKGALRISKKKGAPENLPFLTPRELRTAFR